MTAQWNSIFIRDAFGDSGTIPSGAATACHSPDIIPYGLEPMANFPQELVSTWNQDIGVDVVLDKRNYLYVRGKNSSAATGSVSGNFHLYYVPSGTILQPTSLTLIPGQGDKPVTVGPTAPGDIATPDRAFVWKKPAAPPKGQHYCLMATFSNSGIRNPVTEQQADGPFRNIYSYIQWVVDNPNLAWRNITTVPSGAVLKTTSINISNPDAEKKNYIFLAECSSIPLGTKLKMTCKEASILVKVTAHTRNFAFGPTGLTTLPGNLDSVPLKVKLQAPRGEVLNGASVTIRQLALTEPRMPDSLQSSVRPHRQFSQHPIINQPQDLQSIPVVRCGEFSVYFSTPSDNRVPLRSVDS